MNDAKLDIKTIILEIIKVVLQPLINKDKTSSGESEFISLNWAVITPEVKKITSIVAAKLCPNVVPIFLIKFKYALTEPYWSFSTLLRTALMLGAIHIPIPKPLTNIKIVNKVTLKSFAKNDRDKLAEAERIIPVTVNILCPNLSESLPEIDEAITVPVPE